MKPLHILFLILTLPLYLIAQRNCNVYKLEGDSCRYKACVFLENAPRYFQLTKAFQDIQDEALTICPQYSDAYRAKSVAYLKTGDFIQWKILMDKAVAINPEDHLGYRGWCRFQFFRDYKGALKDLERLESIVKYDIGFSQNGTYHLTVVKALCHKMLGDKETALRMLTFFVSKEKDNIGLYDYLHLGVLYLELENYDQALHAFRKQEAINDIAENKYYMALAYKKRSDLQNCKTQLTSAKKLYENKRFMHDTYTHQVDKIYLADIEQAINSLHK